MQAINLHDSPYMQSLEAPYVDKGFCMLSSPFVYVGLLHSTDVEIVVIATLSSLLLVLKTPWKI